MCKERLAIIQAKLFQLIEKDKEFKIFGSNEPWNGHRYVLNAAAEKNKIHDFENFMDVKLPVDYKSFITTIGDGYAGPFYGLYCLDEAVYQTGLQLGIQESEAQDDWINCFAEFPITQAQCDTYIHNLIALKKRDGSYFDRDDYPEEELPFIQLNGNPLRGALYLCEYGCGGYYILVVKGECYGQVWYSEEGKRLAPLSDSTGRTFTFFDWYEYWLDKSLRELH